MYLLHLEPIEHDGWVPPECLISYTTEGGSRMAEEVLVVPDEEGLNPLVPEGARPI